MTKERAIEEIRQHLNFLSEYGLIEYETADVLTVKLEEIISKIDSSKEMESEVAKYWTILKKLNLPDDFDKPNNNNKQQTKEKMKLLKVITKILSSASKLNSEFILKLDKVLADLQTVSNQGGKLCVELSLDKDGKISVSTHKELPRQTVPKEKKVVKPVVKTTKATTTKKK